MRCSMPQSAGQVVYTNKAHCRDCYRCLRVCPVKAIRMKDGQAYVEPDRCITCGTCVRECPQGAKTFRDDTEKAIALLKSPGKTAASIAPSFVAMFSEWERQRLPSALRRLGFSYVSETAVGAYHVSVETARYTSARPDQSHVCTSCPAVVSFVEKYRPENADLLVPIFSPMLAHAGMMKEKLGEGTKVVFIGPCVAKKGEAERPEARGLVDCVLTFAELTIWLEREGISFTALEESSFDDQPEGDSRLYPLAGGSLKTACISTDSFDSQVLAVSGYNEMQEALKSANQPGNCVIIEPLFCSQGCVNGPAIKANSNLYGRRHDVLNYATSHPGRTPDVDDTQTVLNTSFKVCAVDTGEDVTEAQIMEVLDKTGKASPENQLNCGACGYASCRDKAIAVVQGMAEPEMCIPYMKRLAEARTDKILVNSPNGIVILDEHLNILSMNQAFRDFFMCSEAICGKPISYLMDPDPFERLVTGDDDRLEVTVKHDRYGIVSREMLYKLPHEKQYVGIFIDITKMKADKEQLDSLRVQTATQAKELLEHQISMAQTLAKYLGENTARSEQLLEKLMTLSDEDSQDPEDGRKSIWDTYTSK